MRAIARLSRILLLLGAFCGAETSSNAELIKPAKARKPAPDFELRDSNGNMVRLSSFKGKVVLINFWATWCGPCKIEMPWFNEFHAALKDQGLVVLGVAMDDDGWSVVRPYIAAKRISYPILLGTDAVASLYGGVESLPTTLIVDREGRIAAVHIGLVSRRTYESDIQPLM